MPYHPRRHQLQENIAYHVMNRGNRKCDIFHDDNDFKYFMRLLSLLSRKKLMNIYHWVIMSNHYHLLIEMALPEALSSVMAGINRSYTHYYHKKYGTAGFLWQGRFKSQPIQKDRYLFACGRYIERNPVRANLTHTAEEYAFSSARYYLKGERDNVTTENPFYITFGRTAEERRILYREFLLDFDPQDTQRYNNTKPVGDESFRQKLINERGHYFPRRHGRSSKKGIFVS